MPYPNSLEQTIKSTFRTHFKRYGLNVLSACIVVLFLLLSSINDSTLINPTIISKTLYFVYGLIVLLGLTTLFYFFSWRSIIQAKISNIDIALLVLLVYIVINRYYIQPNFGFSLRFIELLGLSFFYLVLRILPRKNYPLLFMAIVISGTLQAIYGLLQVLGFYPSLHSGFNISGSYFNPGPFAGFLACVWPVALGLYFFRHKIMVQVRSCSGYVPNLKSKIIHLLVEYVPLLGMATIAIVLPATRSRAAWLAVLACSMLLLANKYNILKVLRSFNWNRRVISFVSICMVFGAVFYGIYHFKKNSADGRVLIWKVSTDIIKKSPFLGVGFDRFKAHYMDAQADYFASRGDSDGMVADNSYYAFNEILQFVIENGLVGLVLFALLLFFIVIVPVSYKNRFLKVLGLSILLSTLVFGLFSYPAQILPIKMVAVMALAVLAKIDRKKYQIYFEMQGTSKASKIWLVKIALTTMVLVLIGSVYTYAKNTEKAFRYWKIAMDTYGYGLYEDSLKEFEKAWPTLKNDGDFLMNYGKTLNMAGKHASSIEILKRAKYHLNTTIIETTLGDSFKVLGQYKNAEVSYRHAANMIPHRFYPLYLLAKLYDESGQLQKAKATAREILAKEIKVSSTAIREIKSEMERIVK